MKACRPNTTCHCIRGEIHGGYVGAIAIAKYFNFLNWVTVGILIYRAGRLGKVE